MTDAPAPPVLVALYMRASSEHQRYSVGQQTTLLNTYAAARGYVICRSYVDDGRSGLTLAERPGLQGLLADIVDGSLGFSRVLVLDVSRWGRFQDPDEGAHYEYLCQEGGVAVDYCYEAFENGPGAMNALIKNIKRIMAAEYSRELSQKVLFAQRHHAQRGFKQGGIAPYGFRREQVRNGEVIRVLRSGEQKSLSSDKVRLAHGPRSELEAIRAIFRLRIENELSQRAIAVRLGRLGRKGRNGPWTEHGVKAVLSNELVTGVYVFNKQGGPLKSKHQRKPDDEVVRVKVLPAIVSAELFRLAQQVPHPVKRENLSREEALTELRRLLSLKGYLSRNMVVARFGPQEASAILKIFGSFRLVCEASGYPWHGVRPRRLMSGEVRRFPSQELASEAVLLGGLRNLLAREGRLTSSLVKRASDCATPSTYHSRFGSLREAYALVGYSQSRAQQSSASLKLFWASDEGKRRHLAHLDDILRRLIPAHLQLERFTHRALDAFPGAPRSKALVRDFGSVAKARLALVDLLKREECKVSS